MVRRKCDDETGALGPEVGELETHCVRLGHPVPFRYCQQPAQPDPCFRIVDCWWETFDVVAHLKSVLPERTLNKLLEGRKPPDRMQTILEIVANLRTKEPSRQGG